MARKPKPKFDLLMVWHNQEAIRALLKDIEQAEKDTKPMRQPFELYQRLAGICVDGFVNDTKHKWEYKMFSEKVKAKCFEMVKKPNKMTMQWRGLYWDMLLAETYEFFESYLYYMEMKRPYEKKFYEPRCKTLNTVVKDLQALEDGNYKFYGLSLPSRTGKALAYDTPVLTDHGWKKHGELTILDRVIGLDGKFKRILAIHNPCKMEYKVTFSNKEEVICHGAHEWCVYDRHSSEVVTKETQEIAENVTDKDGHKRYSIPTRAVVDGEYKNLKPTPYVLGAWLGDGRNTNPDLCGDEKDHAIIDKIISDGYELSWKTTHKTTNVKYYGIKGLRFELQEYDMCHSRRRSPKRIPSCYLTASVEQRLELLAGLLDTDGSLVQKENRYQFTTNEEQLRDDFVTLVNSFGWRTCVTEYAPTTSASGITARKPYWVISFNPTMYIPCQLERKQIKDFSKQRNITIANIEKLSDDENIYGNCITVEDGIYRVGKTLIPTHNSTLCVFFLTWIVLRHPASHSAMCGHSGVLADHFYKELIDLFTTEEYTFMDMYMYWHPDSKGLVDKSADKDTISFETKGNFPQLTCRGIDGTWTGAIDISSDGYLYIDDLVRDRTHSLSPTRMDDTFSEYLNKCVDRKNNGAKELMVGTLWNVLDPLMRMEEMYKDDPQYKFRRIPALDFDTDESNFDYTVNGFPTEYYRDMRERMIKAGNEAEWWAKFQQKPYVREGLLFPLNELGYFNGIITDDHKYEYVVCCDVAFGGGDNVSMPVGLKDLETGVVYVVDWYYNSAGVKVTVPGVADMLIKHGVRTVTFERNNGGLLFAKQVNEELQNRGYLCACETKPAPNNISKTDKIKSCEEKIKARVKFLDGTDCQVELEDGMAYYPKTAQYDKALRDMAQFVTIGKNINDDAVDSISQMCLKAFGDINSMATVETISRAMLGF